MSIKLSPLIWSSKTGTVLLALSLTTMLVMSTGCTSARHRHRAEENATQQVQTAPTGPASDVGDAEVIQAQDSHRKKVEVTFTAPVYKMLPEDTRGIEHQRFLVSLSNGTTVLVAHNTDLAPMVPIHEGDSVTLHGEYIWNRRGGIMHYTHHSTNRHESGYIDFAGQRYQ